MSFGPKFTFERGPMMGPILAPMAAVGGLVGAGISAYGSYQSMEAQSANAAYQAQVAANNAKIAQQNAAMDIQAGEIQAANQGLKTRAAVGTIKAQEAAQGVDVNTGSFTKVRAAASEIGMMDALTLRSDAAKAAYGQEVAATSETAQSGLYTAQSQQASAAAPIGALGGLLSSASSVGSTYAKYQNANPNVSGYAAGTGLAGSSWSLG
jgi:hypothetical protein